MLGVAAALFVGTPAVRSQKPPPETAAAVLAELRDVPERFEERRAVLAQRLADKRALLEALEGRLEGARDEEDPLVRGHRVSRYGYQTLLVASRVAAAESKLRGVEALLALGPRLDAVAAEALVAAALEDAVRDRRATAARLLAKAEDRAALITERTFELQLERLRAGLQAEVERLGGER